MSAVTSGAGQCMGSPFPRAGCLSGAHCSQRTPFGEERRGHMLSQVLSLSFRLAPRSRQPPAAETNAGLSSWVPPHAQVPGCLHSRPRRAVRGSLAHLSVLILETSERPKAAGGHTQCCSRPAAVSRPGWRSLWNRDREGRRLPLLSEACGAL